MKSHSFGDDFLSRVIHLNTFNDKSHSLVVRFPRYYNTSNSFYDRLLSRVIHPKTYDYNLHSFVGKFS